MATLDFCEQAETGILHELLSSSEKKCESDVKLHVRQWHTVASTQISILTNTGRGRWNWTGWSRLLRRTGMNRAVVDSVFDDHCVKINHHDEQSIIGFRYRLAFCLIWRWLQCYHPGSVQAYGIVWQHRWEKPPRSSQLHKGIGNLTISSKKSKPQSSCVHVPVSKAIKNAHQVRWQRTLGLPMIAPSLRLASVFVLKPWYPLMACIATWLRDYLGPFLRHRAIDFISPDGRESTCLSLNNTN